MDKYQKKACEVLAGKNVANSMFAVTVLALLSAIFAQIPINYNVKMHYFLTMVIWALSLCCIGIFEGIAKYDFKSTDSPTKKDRVQAMADYLKRIEEIEEDEKRQKASAIWEAKGL
jgi:hypothetical protein